jgi:signal transduction histidine kinase
MSRYDELRPYYSRNPDERMALLEQELRAPLAEANRLAAELGATDASNAAALYGGRFGELVEILAISSAKLAEVAGRVPTIRERAAGAVSDEEVHIFRHDLLTPIGTVRGVASMLAKTEVRDTAAIPVEFIGKAEELAAIANEIKDILDALTDARGRGM